MYCECVILLLTIFIENKLATADTNNSEKIWPLVVNATSNVTIYEGEDALFYCYATNDKNARIQWLLIEAAEIAGVRPKYTFLQSADGSPEILILRDVRKADAGHYTCVMANEFGSKYEHMYLTVLNPTTTRRRKTATTTRPTITTSTSTTTTMTNCGKPNNITNGIVALDTPNKFGLNSTATVTCYPGFNANTKRIVCKERGIWESASCIPKDCGPPPSVANGNVVLDNTGNTKYGAAAALTCSSGYTANITSIACTKQGIWQIAVCSPKDCGQPIKVANGNIVLDHPASTTYGSSATLTCNSGYDAYTARIACTEQGTWESAVCIARGGCGLSQWQCQNGQCIYTSARCDNFPDCVDETDEQNCTDYMACNYGWRKCFHSDGNFTCTDQATPCDCGFPGNILYGTATLDVSGNSSIGASATVTCDYGYQTSSPKIICFPFGLWTNTNCIGKDCGPLPSIPAGHFVLVDPKNTTYGASATVTCLTGYQANVTFISCLASGLWEYASCRAVAGCGSSQWQCPNGQCISNSAKCDHVPDCIDETDENNCTDSSLPASTITPNENNNNTILIIVLVLVFGVACLIQLCVATCLYVMIYRTYTSRAGKAVWFVLQSAIPFIGIVFIIRFHKAFHEHDTKPPHRHPQQLDIISTNTADDLNTTGLPSAKIDGVEDMASMKNAAQDDNTVHYDYINLEHEAENTDNTRGNRSTMAMDNSAVVNSDIELHDEGKTYQHLRPERRHSDRYNELRSANLQKGCDNYTQLQSGNLQKDSDHYTQLQSGNLQKDSDQYTKLQSGYLYKDSDQYTQLQSGNLQKDSDHYTRLQSGNPQNDSDQYTKLQSGDFQKESDQ